MKSLRLLALSSLALASLTLGFAACGAKEEGPRVVKITSNDEMKYNKRSFKAKVGETVSIELTNVGKMPVKAMGHNLVILKPGVKTMEFGAAAITAVDTGYIPASMKDSVVAHTKVLGPGESDTITFTPTVAGTYPFLCSFPGHAGTMNGQIQVK